MFNQQQQWMEERCGKFTASEIYKLLAKGRAKDKYFGDVAETYIRQKVAEILTMEPNNGGRANVYAMEWGNAHEAEAVARFEKESGFTVEYFGGANPKFFEYSDFSGGSPDGLVGDTAIIEVKCPYNSAEHLAHIMLNDEKELKDYAHEYYWQMVWNMIVTKRTVATFISHDPRYADESLQYKQIDFILNNEDAELIKERVSEAEKQLKVMVKMIRNDI